MILRMLALYLKVNRNKWGNTYKNSRHQKNVILLPAYKLIASINLR